MPYSETYILFCNAYKHIANNFFVFGEICKTSDILKPVLLIVMLQHKYKIIQLISKATEFTFVCGFSC